MTNHVHLIVDPGEKAENLALLMKRVAGRQTRYVNRREGRRGTLWEGRYKSSPIEEDRYLLACCRYVELNPVRAGLVEAPEQYPWSSFRQKAGLVPMDWLDPDPCYVGLGRSGRARAARYRTWVRQSVPEGEWTLIRQAVQRGQLTGSARFVDAMEEKLGRRIEYRGQGRPRKPGK
jgi:putative transposase